MNLPARLFLLLITIAFALNGFCQGDNYDPDRLYSVEKLQTDFQFLRTRLEKRHPNLYLYTPKAKLDQFLDSLYKSITSPLTETAFYNRITLLYSKIRDGHTMLLPGEEATNYFNKNDKFFPFYIVILNGKLYVNMNCSADTSIKEGAEILSINGNATSDILNQLLTRQIRDGNNPTYPIWILTTYFKEYFGFSFGHPLTYLITYKMETTGPQTITMNALLKDSIRLYRQKKYAGRILLSKEKQGIVLELNNLTNIATLTIKSFDRQILKSEYKQDFESTVGKMFTQIQNEHVTHLILDIRDNQGGDFETGRLLLTYLLQKPIEYLENSVEHRTLVPIKNNYSGDLYVLINGGSFSNSGIVSSYLESTKRGIFIGEETGGNKNIISGEPIDLVLPNTKMMVQISTKKFVIRNGPDDGHGVVPAYSITPAIDNIIRGKDTVKEFVLSLITKK
jgi:Peptidase family S41